MPIYEFRCQECNTLFEKLVFSAADQKSVVCSRCGSSKVKKAVSATSYRLASGSPSPFGSGGGCPSSGGFS